MTVEIIKLGASWCAPCKVMDGILDAIETEKGITIKRVDIDEEPELKELYSIRSIPTLVLTNNLGTHMTSGGKTKQQVLEFLESNGAF